MSIPPPMERTSNPPVMQKTVEAYKLWHGALNSFPRLSRYSLGIKIDVIFTELIESILLAGYANHADKQTAIANASAKLDVLKFFLQVAWEMKCLDHKKYAALSSPIHEIGRMIGGWQKAMQIKQSSLI